MKLNKVYGLLALLIMSLALSCSMTACGSDDEPSDSGNSNNTGKESNMTPEQKRTFETLAETTWRIVSSKSYGSDGDVRTDYLAINPEFEGATITFTNQRIHDDYYKILCSSFPGKYADWIFLPEYSDCSFFMTAHSGGMDGWDSGSFLSIFGSGKIDMNISGNQLTLTNNELNKVVKYVRVSGSGGGNGDYGSYETPDVDFYDYTPFGATSVKVDYIIYNKSEAGVQSAVIRYGTSTGSMRSASTNIVGIHAIANISGLKANTDYYVECEVKSKGGNVTTSTTCIRL